jgi:hypothetical protein
VLVDAVRDHLGVGLGGEEITRRLQLGAQLVVVLDDAVVDDGKTVRRDVRMGVALGGDAVRGPAAVVGEASIASCSRCTLPTVRSRLSLPVPLTTATPAES